MQKSLNKASKSDQLHSFLGVLCLEVGGLSFPSRTVKNNDFFLTLPSLEVGSIILPAAAAGGGTSAAANDDWQQQQGCQQ